MQSIDSNNDIDVENQWLVIQDRLKNTLGEAVYKSWISLLRISSLEGNRLEISTPSRFTCDWIKTHYKNHIQDVAAQINSNIKWVDIIVKKLEESDTSLQQNTNISFTEKKISPSDGAHLTLPSGGEVAFPSHLDPSYTFENFIVGKSNELAYAAAMRVTESEKPAFNPLFLYGGVGLGKTHLMHAIAWRIQKQHPKRRVIYLSAEKFMYQFICALRQKDMMSFKDQFRTVDVLMIDDVQFIGGKDSTQEEFFHTFNALVDQNKQMILSADKSPSNLDGLEERLRSRLGWGLVADIHPTTYELRLGILQSKVEQLNIHVPEKVLEFLAHKITSNIRELEGALKRIAAHSSLVGREINLELTQVVLRDLLRANDRRTSIEEIKKKICQRYSLKMSELEGSRRQRAIARPRQISMYLCKKLTSKSLPEIGRSFGGRDHTTIIHAVRTVERLMQEDDSMAEDIEILIKTLGN